MRDEDFTPALHATHTPCSRWNDLQMWSSLDRLFEHWPTSKQVAPLVPIVERIEARDPRAVRELFEQTGKVVGVVDAHHARESEGLDAFIARCLAPPLPQPGGLTGAEVVELVRRITVWPWLEGQQDYALEILCNEFDQPYLNALIYWPRDLEELAPERIVRLAHEVKGAALADFLDEGCQPVDPGVMPERPKQAMLALARELLVRLVERDLIQITHGEMAAQALAHVLDGLQPSALGQCLIECDAVDEVWADDETLAATLEALRVENSGG